MGRFGVRVWALVAAVATALGVWVAAVSPQAGATGVTPSTTTLSAMSSPFQCDQRVTATVQVSAAPAPTGTVQFVDGATPVGAPVALPNTAALSKSVSSSLIGLTPGSHTITAQYSGDATYAPSTGVGSPVTFAPYKSIVTEAASPAAAVQGLPISFPVTIAADSHCVRKPAASVRATGTVSYMEGATSLGTGTLVNGYATFTTGAFPVGTHTVTATYAGDANFAAGSTFASANVLAPSGKAWRAQSLDNVGLGSTSVVFNGLPHVFYYDQANHDLKHLNWNGKAWVYSTIDGATAGPNGRTADDVGQYPTALIAPGNVLHLFYYDATFGDLRHAWYQGGWHLESLDGFTGPHGRSNADVGLDNAAIVFNGQVNVFYRSTDGMGHNRLRHAWLVGTTWFFETLDGSVNNPTTGQICCSTGFFNTAIIHNGLPHVFSYTGSNLRHGLWTGKAWHFETLDGAAIGSHGQVNNNVGAYAQALEVNGAPQVFYQQTGAPAKLRRAWYTAGIGWQFQTIDGLANNPATGAIGADVGYDITALLFNNQPHIWYRDATNHSLRHLFWTGSAWRFDIDDGFASRLGQRPNIGVPSVSTASSMVWNGSPQVFSTDTTTGQLRRTWFQ
jgi:Bacterial Ig-like domain (group 3)